ncbi:polysaccharide pyruvyl transferase family protein [uncultured Ornithinimicrobium sp.]|uniref:polysaccharide pyruvyl transferase family protein n=1 Tax=uncultured Ornithinimicrobium sp. TaxID=259307 RepID=UPI0025978D70|nr:polysaccharide pyruvyl transferase family protein [uncultured Ornithinimicrobium sp.]
MKATIANIHGDNYGDFLNALAAKTFVTEWLSAEVQSVLPAGGVSRWEHLPDVGPLSGVDGPPQGIYDAREISYHLLRIPHKCHYAADWEALAAGLQTSDYLISAPSGANVGPYRDSAFLAPFVTARRTRTISAILGGTVHPSGSWKYDTLAQLTLNRTHLSVRDETSAEFLRRTGRQFLGPIDISFAAARDLGAAISLGDPRDDYVCVIVGDTLSWHPEASTIEGDALAESLAFRILTDVSEAATKHGLRVVVLPNSPLDSEKLRLSRLCEMLDGPTGVEIAHRVRTVEDYVRVIAAARLVVSMRYHGIVTALANAVPVVAISYEPKSSSIMNAAGFTEMLLTHVSYATAHARKSIDLALRMDRDKSLEARERFESEISQVQLLLATKLRHHAEGHDS